jgi:NAD(P) transhydrogenase subunit alpha
MTPELVAQITVAVLAAFVGFEVISKVPTMLHTPLMSATNAIHGVVLVGALIVLASNPESTYVQVVGFLAVVFGTMNVVGGFVVTDRMLEMFKPREEPPPAAGDRADVEGDS